MKPIFLLLAFLWYGFTSYAQTNIDALSKVWNNKNQSGEDRLEAIDQMIIAYLATSVDSAIIFAQEQNEFASQRSNDKYQASALHHLGEAYEEKGDLIQGLDYFFQSLKIRAQSDDQAALANTQFKLGVLLKKQGKIDESLDYHIQSLKIREAVGDKKRIAESLNQLGFVYQYLTDYETAFDYFNRNLNIRIEIGDSLNMAWALNNLGNLVELQNDLTKSMEYHMQSLNISKKINHEKGLAASYNNIGLMRNDQGDFIGAIDYFTKSLKISERIGYKINMANVLNSIGNIYMDLAEYQKAIEYQNRTLKLYEELGIKYRIGLALNNLGISYEKSGEYDKAIDRYERSIKIKEESSDEAGLATTLNNIGVVYMFKNEYAKARSYLNRSLEMDKILGNKVSKGRTLNSLASLNLIQNDYKNSIEQSTEAYEIGTTQSSIFLITEAAQNLYLAYRQTGNYRKALEFNEIYINTRDSINRSDNHRELIRQEYKYDYEKQSMSDSLNFAKQTAIKDIALIKQQANISRQRIALFGVGGGLLLIALLAFSIFQGKKRSDELLLNILPAEVARELKQKGFAEAREFEQATILFTDFKDFTSLSEQMSADELVKEIDTCFKAFDGIIEKYNIEKIKTIGDAYMAAGGLHIPRTSEPKDEILAGLEMQQFIKTHTEKRIAQQLPAFEMRVGIHSGPVVAGIVGIKKFQYDIWGDAVNIASRMESSGEVRRVNISEATYQLVNDLGLFSFETRGKVEAKGKGKINMYFAQNIA